MPKIKTRDTVKDIKALDKSAIAAERMKDAFVHTKEKAEHGYYSEEGSPGEYAADNITHAADRATDESAHALNKAGQKGFEETKRNIGKAREKIKTYKEKKAADAENISNAAEQAANQPVSRTANQPKEQLKRRVQSVCRTARSSRQGAEKSIKTVERSEKTIKQSVRSTVKTVKATGEGTVKAAQKSVKTAEQTAKVAVKTTQQAAKTAQQTAQATVKASQKAAQAAKVAAKAAVATAKAAVKATVATVKALIAATKALVAAIVAGGWIAVLIIIVVVLLGGALALLGGGNSNTTTPVSEEVEAYEPLIRQCATEYGIPEYVELIKAVMMQESGGRGLDPMQAAEGSFNTQYPHTPNGITDPEYSIRCGVQELKDCLTRAKVESPVDMERIKLALQGYNYGNGYISWAVAKDGGYTSVNAAEFSDMMAQKMGWASYGDKQYVPHVLQYYPFGRIPTGFGNDTIVQVALTQVGNQGGQPYWSWYGFDSRVEWCACFVSWCANECGYIDSGIIPKFAACASEGVPWFRQHGQWQDGSYTPSPGDIIFYDWENDGESDHVGIVERVENGTVYTVEGNSGDACRQKNYPIGSGVIYGYGILCP